MSSSKSSSSKRPKHKQQHKQQTSQAFLIDPTSLLKPTAATATEEEQQVLQKQKPTSQTSDHGNYQPTIKQDHGSAASIMPEHMSSHQNAFGLLPKDITYTAEETQKVQQEMMNAELTESAPDMTMGSSNRSHNVMIRLCVKEQVFPLVKFLYS